MWIKKWSVFYTLFHADHLQNLFIGHWIALSSIPYGCLLICDTFCCYKFCFFYHVFSWLCYAKSVQSCPTLCDPIDGSPPGFPVPGILQTRTLEWVAIAFSNAWKWKVKVKLLSHVRLLVTPWTAPTGLLCPWDLIGFKTSLNCDYNNTEGFLLPPEISPRVTLTLHAW